MTLMVMMMDERMNGEEEEDKVKGQSGDRLCYDGDDDRKRVRRTWQVVKESSNGR
jgi:hypothetical protein